MSKKNKIILTIVLILLVLIGAIIWLYFDLTKVMENVDESAKNIAIEKSNGNEINGIFGYEIKENNNSIVVTQYGNYEPVKNIITYTFENDVLKDIHLEIHFSNKIEALTYGTNNDNIYNVSRKGNIVSYNFKVSGDDTKKTMSEYKNLILQMNSSYIDISK